MEKNWVFKKKTSPVGIFGFIVILGFIVFFLGGAFLVFLISKYLKPTKFMLNHNKTILETGVLWNITKLLWYVLTNTLFFKGGILQLFNIIVLWISDYFYFLTWIHENDEGILYPYSITTYFENSWEKIKCVSFSAVNSLKIIIVDSRP